MRSASKPQAASLERSRPPQRLGNRVPDYPPQPLVGDADEPGHGQHRHLPDQDHCTLLEQQGEAAFLPRPRNDRPLHPMLGAVRPRRQGGIIPRPSAKTSFASIAVLSFAVHADGG